MLKKKKRDFKTLNNQRRLARDCEQADFRKVRQTTDRLNLYAKKAKISAPEETIDLITAEIAELDKNIELIESKQVRGWLIEIRGILRTKLEATV